MQKTFLKAQHNKVLFRFSEETILFTEFCKTEKTSRLVNFNVNMDFTNTIQNLLHRQQKIASILTQITVSTVSLEKDLGRNTCCSIFSVLHPALHACWSTHIQLYSITQFSMIMLSLPQQNYINVTAGKKKPKT